MNHKGMMKKHSKSHSKKHINSMKKYMKSGKTFMMAHRLAMKKVGN